MRITGLWNPTATALLILAIVLGGCGPSNGLPALTGEFVYVANAEDGTISEFQIDTATGQLSFVGSIPTSSTAGLIIGQAVHPTNEFLYVADAAAEVFGFDIGDGSFSGRLFGPNSTVPAVNGPAEAAIDPAGLCLYVTNFGGTADSVSQYSINEHNGVLTSLGSTPTGENPLGIAIAPVLGAFLVTANRSGQSAASFTVTGSPLAPCTLTLATTLDLSVGAVAATPEFVAFDPFILASSEGGNRNQALYVTDDGLGVVDEIVSHNDSTISLLGSVAPQNGGLALTPDPFSIVVHPSGNFVYTGSTSPGAISVFTLDAFSGLLKWQSNETTGIPSPFSLAIDKQGKYLYAANSSDSTIAQFSIDPGTGALTPIGEPNTVNAENPANAGSVPTSIVSTN